MPRWGLPLQQLRGLVPVPLALMVFGGRSYFTQSKWLKGKSLKKVLVWTWACAQYARCWGQVVNRTQIEVCSNCVQTMT